MSSKDPSAFEKAVRQCMLDRGIKSVADLARVMGRNPKTVTGYLNGDPRLSTVFAIANAMEIKPETIIELMTTGQK